MYFLAMDLLISWMFLHLSIVKVHSAAIDSFVEQALHGFWGDIELYQSGATSVEQCAQACIDYGDACGVIEWYIYECYIYAHTFDDLSNGSGAAFTPDSDSVLYARTTGETSECAVIGATYVIPDKGGHDCECVEKCGGQYCNTIQQVEKVLGKDPQAAYCETGICCCSCENCDPFNGYLNEQ